MVMFDVSAVARGVPPTATVAPKQAVATLIGPGAKVHSAGARTNRLAPSPAHGFVDAAGLAFAHHLPLTMSPDEVWLMIAQGFALSQPFEPSAPRKRLIVWRDDFRLEGDNPWPEVFSEFSDKIREHVGPDLHGMLTPTFSTTGPLERAAHEVVLMSALKNLFEYEFVTSCGIPQIRLLGTTADWQALADHANRLCSAHGLEWWWKELGSVLAAFVAASRGEVDRDFWRSFYKLDDVSGGPVISGWINVLMPFLENQGIPKRNKYATEWRQPRDGGFPSGLGHADLPAPLANAPVHWKYHHHDIGLDFCAGFLGVERTDDGGVRPGVGWGVVEHAPGRRSATR